MGRLQIEFAGIFLTPESRAQLLAAHPPAHAKIYGDHATLSFRPSSTQLRALQPALGTHVALVVRRVVSDDRGHAAQVAAVCANGAVHSAQGPRGSNLTGGDLHLHVTLATVAGTGPEYSNTMLCRAIEQCPSPGPGGGTA